MRFEHPVSVPELLPLVPVRLAQKLTEYLYRTRRIDIRVQVGPRRWDLFNVLHLDDESLEAEYGPDEVVLVGGWIMACTLEHAEALGRDGKYRAVLVRSVGETDRHTATFKVERELEAERRRRKGIQWSKSGNPWEDLVIANHALLRVMVEYHDRMMDRLLEQSRIRRERSPEQRLVKMLIGILGELAGVCDEGLRMQADVTREVNEQRMRVRLAELRAQHDARVWETFEPVLEQAIGRFLDEAHRAGGDATEQDAERTEGAAPSSGDAPSEGEDGSEE